MDNQTNENEIFNEDKKERALLISVDTGDFNAEVSMEELEELAKTAGAEVVGTSIQKRQTPVAATYIGKGALYEMTRFCENMNIDLIIADSELSPVQIRNLEDETNTRVIDRTTLILDILQDVHVQRRVSFKSNLPSLNILFPALRERALSFQGSAAALAQGVRVKQSLKTTKGISGEEYKISGRSLTRSKADVK